MTTGTAANPEVLPPDAPPPDAAGAVKRTGFGTTEVSRASETAAAAQAAKSRALVESRLIVAMQRQRTWLEVRQRLLGECKRPGFAESAWYQVKNRGEGLSIRFAEAAIRCMGNVSVDTTTLYDDDGGPGVVGRRVLHVETCDMETNAVYGKDITILKQVERKNPAGREVLGKRTNSYGEDVYIVRATEEELLGIENAHVSKTIRGGALRILPGDIKDECEAEIVRALREGVSADPKAALKKVCDGFAAMNVMPSDLADYLGHSIETATPAEITHLRGVWTAIKNGEATLADLKAARDAPPKSRTEELAEKLAATGKAGAAAPPSAPAEEDKEVSGMIERGVVMASTPEAVATRIQERWRAMGAEAAKRGDSHKACPYKPNTPGYARWQDGFKAAHEPPREPGQDA